MKGKPKPYRPDQRDLYVLYGFWSQWRLTEQWNYYVRVKGKRMVSMTQKELGRMQDIQNHLDRLTATLCVCCVDPVAEIDSLVGDVERTFRKHRLMPPQAWLDFCLFANRRNRFRD